MFIILKIFEREKKKEKLNSLLGKAEQLERFNNDLRQECYRSLNKKTELSHPKPVYINIKINQGLRT